MSYSSEQSNACQPTSVDRRKILHHLRERDQCDLVTLEYIAQKPGGVTVLDMMPVMGLSNPATSGRLRRMSDAEYGRIDTQIYSPLLERHKSAGENGADRICLAEGVTLADIQKIMADKGYSYESYHAKRQEKKKKKNNSDNYYEDEAHDNLENESIEVDSDQVDAQFLEKEENQEESNSLKPDTDTKEIDGADCGNEIDAQFLENEENQEESNSLEPDPRYGLDTKEIDSSDCDNEDIEGIEEIEEVFASLLKEVVEIKQNYTAIKEDYILLKEEIADLKRQLAKSGSSKKLVTMMKKALAPNANQNGKDVR